MLLVVGLGNPGTRYAANRHNAGFLAVQEMARSLGCGPWRQHPLYEAAAAALPAQDPGRPARSLYLMKPMTYMNRSGDALTAWAAAHGSVPDLLVICDDLHLPLGSLRLRPGGASGGQNGLAHILEVMGTQEVPRLRLGIGPRDLPVAPQDWADYVLEDFPTEDMPAVREMTALAATAALYGARAGWEAAAGRFNVRIRGERPPDQA